MEMKENINIASMIDFITETLRYCSEDCLDFTTSELIAVYEIAIETDEKLNKVFEKNA